jgi:cyclopropane fatty-acyl-phospholipid synthase-like methyltransferase
MRFFDRAYEGLPLWEIGRPQPEFVRLEEAGAIRGRVLDLGCGTGELALFLASRGHPVWGVDFSPNAIRRATTKAAERGIELEFRVASALALDRLGATFDTALDCGLFHVFLDEHRRQYAENVRQVLAPAGTLFLLCFSEEEPTDWGGPRRVTQAEIRETFADGWEVRSIQPGNFEVRTPEVQGRAWLAELRVTNPAKKARERTSTLRSRSGRGQNGNARAAGELRRRSPD